MKISKVNKPSDGWYEGERENEIVWLKSVNVDLLELAVEFKSAVEKGYLRSATKMRLWRKANAAIKKAQR